MADSTPSPKRRLKPIVMIVGACALAVALGILLVDFSPDPEAGLVDERNLPVNRGASWAETDKPGADGWSTEAFNVSANTQLKILGKLLLHPEKLDRAAATALVTDDFSGDSLRPAALTKVFSDRTFTVERAAPGEAGAADPAAAHQGPDGFMEAVRAAAVSFAGTTDPRFKFKVFDVQPMDDGIATRQYLAVFGETKEGAVEQHATLHIRWSAGEGEALPRIRSIRLEEFEQTTTSQPGSVAFTDCTKSIIGETAAYEEQVLRGLNHWLARNQERRYFALLGNPGIAVGDVDGDGLEDLYLCQEALLPNRLFLQKPDGSAREESAARGVDWLESSRSVLLVDLDNDGDQDLVVAIMGGVVVAENDGTGNFELRDVLASGEDTMSLSAVDYDEDGKLDIYVCVYYADRTPDAPATAGLPGAAAGFVVHDANNGGSNSLWRNEISTGGWNFRDVTSETGLNAMNFRYSFGAAWDDFDNDGDLDLYVANDYGRDNFYRNLGAGPEGVRFADESDDAKVEDSAGGMSITCGDYDRNGFMDVLVSNMWSSAGQRVTHQDQFKPESDPEIRERFQRLARGNTLLQNQGDGSFIDRSEPAGVEMGRWAWGSHFVDFNNDGWEDIIVSNGYITTEDTGDL